MKNKVLLVAIYVAAVVMIAVNVSFVGKINDSKDAIIQNEKYISETRIEIQKYVEAREKTKFTKMYFLDVFVDKVEEKLKNDDNGEICALIAIDGDKFGQKGIELGRPAVNDLIIKFADILKAHFNDEDKDMLCNIGENSDEVFILLTNRNSIEEIENEVQAVQKEIRAVEFLSDEGVKVNGTLSFGIAVFDPKEVDFRMMFKQADQLLYEAKNAGRDRYVIKVID